jgi:CBS domain-containing protein
VRPSVGLDALLKRMQSNNLSSLLVTTPDGKLVGLVFRSQAEERLNASTS